MEQFICMPSESGNSSHSEKADDEKRRDQASPLPPVPRLGIPHARSVAHKTDSPAHVVEVDGRCWAERVIGP